MTSNFPFEKKFRTIHGTRMAYVDEGEGDPILFLHGNPTSSYLWRNVIPHFEGLGRLIAPDLVGMGDSEKLAGSDPERYSFIEHRRYLFALFEELGVEDNVTLVLHDWGSALGFDWARTHQEAVKAIAFMESIVAPTPSWDVFPENARIIFQGFRSDEGEKMILEDNAFVEQVLPTSILRTLTDEEMAAYRAPYLKGGESRRPTLSWPRQLPIEGQPAEVVKIVSDYAPWLAESSVPKFFVNAEPGALIMGAARDFVRSWRNLSEITVKGIHFVQEDSPDEIGRGVASWLAGLDRVVR